MESVIFIYNIFLIVLYAISISYSSKLYLYKKHPFYLCISVLFLFYIFDNTIIYMTEFLDSFSSSYDLMFMNVPAFKTVILVVTAICLILIQNYILSRKVTFTDWFVFMLLTSVLLFAPMISKARLMVWTYYLPHQLLTIYLGITGILYLKNNPDLISKYTDIKMYRNLLILTIIFSIFIIVEDTIVIFRFDVYTDILVKINNRSISEDMLSITESYFAIVYFSRKFNSYMSEGNIQEFEPENTKIEDKQNSHNHMFYKFVKKYNLTSREKDVLIVLLQNKNNQEISDELIISIGTVKSHIHNIFQKVNVSKRSMLLGAYEDFINDNLLEESIK